MSTLGGLTARPTSTFRARRSVTPPTSRRPRRRLSASRRVESPVAWKLTGRGAVVRVVAKPWVPPGTEKSEHRE